MRILDREGGDKKQVYIVGDATDEPPMWQNNRLSLMSLFDLKLYSVVFSKINYYLYMKSIKHIFGIKSKMVKIQISCKQENNFLEKKKQINSFPI